MFQKIRSFSLAAEEKARQGINYFNYRFSEVLCQLNTRKVVEITTSRKSVVSHERKQIPQGRDETECPGTAR